MLKPYSFAKFQIVVLNKSWHYNFSSYFFFNFSLVLKHINVGRIYTRGRLRADLDGTIFRYDCSMRLAHVTSTTQIVKSDV